MYKKHFPPCVYILPMYIYISYKFIGLAVLEIQTFLKIDISEKSEIEWLKINKKNGGFCGSIKVSFSGFCKNSNKNNNTRT